MEGMDTRILTSDTRPTTLKTRIMSGGQHLMRVDEEVDADLGTAESARMLDGIRQCLDAETIHAILIEDYDKGALSPAVIEGVLAEAGKRNIPVTVDPKFRHFDLYRGVALFKPNLKELKEGLGLQWEPGDRNARTQGIDDGLNQLETELRPDAILLTLSEDGVRIRHQGQDGHHPAHPREILDVSGQETPSSPWPRCCSPKACPPPISPPLPTSPVDWSVRSPVWCRSTPPIS